MTATLPDGMEFKDMAQACADAVGSTVWGSEYPEEDGVRNHIVAVTGVRDEVGDIIVPGAFTHTLERLEPKACMGHDWNRPIGYPEAIKELMPGDPRLPREDRFGRPWNPKAGALFARTRYNLDTEDGQRAYKDARFLGARLACSIGYVDPKDDNGTPLYSYKAIDPDTGLMTRFLPRLDLFEYSQVLHGAHPLAGGLKHGKPKRLERKQRPSTEIKVRLVRDSSYWGLPLGTPIRPGMKPQGPKARRLVAAGQQADETAGAVEVDANNLRIKPTAKGKQKGDAAVDTAYSEILGLSAEVGEANPNLDSDAPIDPFDDATFVVVDETGINKGELFNPLDILVANAVPPAEVEDHLRNNSDWDTSRLGDAADRQDEIDSFVADVADAYREKYNAELVRQNDSGDSEVTEPAETSAEDAEVQPAEATGTEGAAAAPITDDATSEPQSGGPADGEQQATQDPNRSPAAPATGDIPEMAVHDGDPVNIRAVDGDTANVYNTRTEQAYDVPVGELLTGGASLDSPVDIALNNAQREAADLAFGNGEPIEEAGAVLTASGVQVGNIAEALATIDARFEVFEDNLDQKRRHGRTLKAVRAKIAKLAKPGDPIQGETQPLADNGNVAPEPSTEVAPEAPSGESTVEPSSAPEDTVGEPGGETDPAPTEADITAMVIAKPDAAAARAAQMNDAELAAYDTTMADRAAQLGKPGQRTAGHQAVADEIARRAETGAAEPSAPTGAEGEAPLAEDVADEGLVEDVDQAQEEAIQQNEILTGDEIADAEQIIDASFGVTEAPDGEFEADPDIADRQDRVASLLVQADAGSLDFSNAADDQLRTTRADIIDEIRLQQHLERRRTGERAVTRQQAESQASDDLVPQEEADEPPVDTGPKPRPGVAGAAEDLADALDDGDQARIDAATERLRKSVNRSRADSPVVAEIRAMLDAPSTELDPITGEPLPGKPDPEALRDAATRLRDEQRAKRNEGARRRRTARRFERERLRSLLGQVEAEMRTRNLDYDPLPDDDGTVTLDLNTAPPVAWTSRTEREGWSGTDMRVDALDGANYSASVTSYPGSIHGDRGPKYSWTVTSDDGAVLATGSGSAPDMDGARASVEIALDTQRKLGLLPIDAQIPQSSVPQDTSATPLTSVVDAVQNMRQRVADGRRVNPLTGQPDPFGEGLQPLPSPAGALFDNPAAARKHLEKLGGRVSEVASRFRWDTAKMTPGGSFVVLDNLKGKAEVLHTVSGGSFNPTSVMIGAGLGKADLLRWAEIAEVTRDRDGRPVDWSKSGQQLRDELIDRSFIADEDELRGLQEAALQRLAREKLAAGAFGHKLVQNGSGILFGTTNDTREKFVADQRRALAQLINVRTGKPTASDKKTLETATGAHTLAALGAPDMAAVLLTRRSAELREQYGADAPSHGSALLDSLAQGYLGAFSPMRSHGERLGSLKPGERVFLADTSEEGTGLRGFRVLAASRRDPHGLPSEYMTPVIDERDGSQKFLHVGADKFRIEDTENRTYGYAALGGDRGSALVVVAGPGEEPPASVDDLVARQFDEVGVIPQDVLDAAAEALPESGGETAARRAAPSDGQRPPRKASARAPRRTAAAPAAPEPVRNEQQLAQAQGRNLGSFLGMPVERADSLASPGFGSIDEAREHLVAVAASTLEREGHGQKYTTANAAAQLISDGAVTLSPGGMFLVSKGGTVSHARSGFRVWPPSPNQAAHEDLRGGGYDTNGGSAMWVAEMFERGVIDGEQIDWQDAQKAVKQVVAIGTRTGVSPISTLQRQAYLDGVLDSKRPRITDVNTLRGMAGSVDIPDMPNPEALNSAQFTAEPLVAYDRAGGYRGGSYSSDTIYVADSKAGAALAKRVALEIRVAEAAARIAPLDTVRRLNRVADELDGQTINAVNVAGSRNAPVEGNAPKTMTPSDDLRAMAKRVTDAFDENKISDATKFRRAGMTGQVEFSSPKITVNRRGWNSGGDASDPLETELLERVDGAGGIRFYRDDNGMLHATFAGYDIADGRHNGRTFDGDSHALDGAIKVSPDGRLTVSFTRFNNPVMIEGLPGAWTFTPEKAEDGGSDTEADATPDISGPETESPQVAGGPEADTPADTEGRIRAVYDELAKEPQDWIRLARIRARLGDVDKAEWDTVLQEMMRTGFVHFAPESNTKVLTDEDRAAALRVGSEDLHLIAIEPPE